MSGPLAFALACGTIWLLGSGAPRRAAQRPLRRQPARSLRLLVVEAKPTGYAELSRHKVIEEGVFWTKPLLVDGLVYLRGSLGDVACLDHRNPETN